MQGTAFRRLATKAGEKCGLAADRSWLQPKYYESDESQGFGVHMLHEDPDHSLAVFAVNWLPGRGTPPHDHGTWTVVAGIEGVERNIRFRRVDANDRPGYAELEVKKEFDAGAGDILCIGSGGIHKVTDETDSMTLSLHTYGRHVTTPTAPSSISTATSARNSN